MVTGQDRREPHDPASLRLCIVGASGKLGRYMVQHALDRGYEVVGVCREVSVDKLDKFTGRITVIAGATDDGEVIKAAVAGCDGVHEGALLNSYAAHCDDSRARPGVRHLATSTRGNVPGR